MAQPNKREISFWFHLKLCEHILARVILNWFLFILLLRNGTSTSAPDVEGEALIDFWNTLNDTDNRIKDWNFFYVSPCSGWSHVTCLNGHVKYLSLGSLGFSGTVSAAICKLKFLNSVELQDNNLSGNLPDCVSSLVNLQNLDLSNNNFSGSIPTTWAQFSNLKHLDLSGNDLSGAIPSQLFSARTFNFTGTRLECGARYQKPCDSSSSLRVTSRKSKIELIMIAASCGAFFLLLLGAAFTYRRHQLLRFEKEVFEDVVGILYRFPINCTIVIERAALAAPTDLLHVVAFFEQYSIPCLDSFKAWFLTSMEPQTLHVKHLVNVSKHHNTTHLHQPSPKCKTKHVRLYV